MQTPTTTSMPVEELRRALSNGWTAAMANTAFLSGTQDADEMMALDATGIDK